MKNSSSNTATTVKSVAVDTVKIVVYPAHLVCQTAADLLNIGQAKAINLIDGTPILESMHEQSTWTQNQQAKVVGKAMEIRERMLKQRDYNRQQDIDKLKNKLNTLEGVESVPTPPVPAAPKKQGPLAKAIAKVEAQYDVPLMTPIEAFEPAEIINPEVNLMPQLQ
jgi:hypothetical protein